MFPTRGEPLWLPGRKGDCLVEPQGDSRPTPDTGTIGVRTKMLLSAFALMVCTTIFDLKEYLSILFWFSLPCVPLQFHQVLHRS